MYSPSQPFGRHVYLTLQDKFYYRPLPARIANFARGPNCNGDCFPSPMPRLPRYRSHDLERLPFVWKTRKFRGEFKWNGSSRWKFSGKKSHTFRSITFFPFLLKRPKFSVPFVWITSARLHVERKWKIYRYFVNGTTQSRSCFRCQKIPGSTSTIWREIFTEISVQMVSAPDWLAYHITSEDMFTR